MYNLKMKKDFVVSTMFFTEHNGNASTEIEINEDGSINIRGNGVYLDVTSLKRIPVKFGYVSGSFILLYCHYLTELECLPSSVGGSLHIRGVMFPITEQDIRNVCQVGGHVTLL